MKRIRGLSLIEVLIALAIIAIAIMAVIQATSQNIRATTYLKEKSAALWVAQYVMNETKLQLITLPPTPEIRKDEMMMLDQNWWWQGSLADTPNPRIKQVLIRVYKNQNLLESNEAILTLNGYVYQEVKL